MEGPLKASVTNTPAAADAKRYGRGSWYYGTAAAAAAAAAGAAATTAGAAV